MADNSERRDIKLKITDEQFWAIYHFFDFNDWDLQEATIYSEWAFDEDQNIRAAAGTSNYVEKKQQLLHRTMDDSIVWTTREVMPHCVLNLVRGLYPNLPGQPYMGHKWL